MRGISLLFCCVGMFCSGGAGRLNRRVHAAGGSLPAQPKEKPGTRPCRFPVIEFLPLILKLQIIQRHRVAVLNPHRLELIEQPRRAQLLVEIHAALVVGEVDVRHQPLQPRALHEPQVVLVPDLQRLGHVDLRRALDVLRFIDRDGRQLGQLRGNGAHKLTRALMKA